MATEKGKGFGRTLMDALRIHLRQIGKVGIGFCDAKNVCGFYRKCGFEVVKNLSHRFRYQAPNGSVQHQGNDRDVFYIESEQSSFIKVIVDLDALITVSVPFW